MRTTAYRLARLALWAALAATSANAPAEDYIHRDLMGNTLASPRCLDRPDAEAHAQDAYLVQKKEKVFCETQGYGWHVAEEKTPGKLVCEECGGNAGKYQCHLEDIVVACKRLKPGSVGLIPGKG
jgi:hypothetical protein